MGTTTWSGPLRSGRRNTAHSNTFGHLMAAQKVGVSGGVAGDDETHTHIFASRLPACDIVGIRAVISDSFAATVSAAAVVHMKIGTTAEASAFGQIALLGPGVYDTGVVNTSGAEIFENAGSALAAWENIAEGTQVVITISAAVTSNISAAGIVYLQYFQNTV